MYTFILPMKGVNNKDAHSGKKNRGSKEDVKKPIQVLRISKKENQVEELESFNNQMISTNENTVVKDISPQKNKLADFKDGISNDMNPLDNIQEPEKPLNPDDLSNQTDFLVERKVDEFDFDEVAFLEALNENEPVGATGDTIEGEIIAIESDGLYIDIGGKAPGFMPKKECGLGVITNFKERFTIGHHMNVLVIKEQNADGMVTVSARALILRESWKRVASSAKNGDLIQVLINGFNRGGLTCDVDGLRGFIPRSQLEDGQDYQSLVSKNLKVAFLEVNPESRKLVLSEKKALLVSKFAELELGQLIEGEVLAVKPYGFFVDLGGASGLLHQSSITNGSIRTLREIFVEGETIKALITEIDLERGRVSLNTALLENSPGELIIDKVKVMNEASERAIKTKSLFDKKDQEK